MLTRTLRATTRYLDSSETAPWLDALMPRTLDPLTQLRGRLLLVSLGLLMVTNVGFFAWVTWVTGTVGAIGVAIGVQLAALFGLTLFLRKTRDTVLTSTVLVISLATLSAIFVAFTKTFNTPLFYWSLTIPMLAAVLVSGRMAMVAAVVIGGATFAFWPYARDGGVLLEMLAAVHVVSVTALVLSITLLGWRYGAVFLRQLYAARSQVQHLDQKMRAREARFTALIEQATDLLTIVDTDGYIRYTSPSIETMLGYSRWELLEHPFTAYVHPEDCKRVLDMLQQVRQQPAAVGRVTFRYRHIHGGWRYLKAHGRNLMDQPEVGGLMVALRDVTDQVSLEEALQDAEQRLTAAEEHAEALRHFKAVRLANLGDEVRMPLARIIGTAAVLGHKIEAVHQPLVARMQEDGEYLRRRLQALLDANQDGGTLEVYLEPVVVGTHVESFARTLRPMAEEKGLTLTVDLQAPEALAALDAHSFDQVLFNLVANAIQYTEEGAVTVSVEADDAWVYVRVKDTGIGIDAKDLPHLFHAFQHKQMVWTPLRQVTGLGLPVVHHLVTLMNGTISVVSQQREGSTFSLCFPQLPADTKHADMRRAA